MWCPSAGPGTAAAERRATAIIHATTKSRRRASPSSLAPPTRPFAATGRAGTRKSCSWRRCRPVTSSGICNLAAEAGIVVTAYIDRAEGVMEISAGGAGRFKSVVLHPAVTVKSGSDIERARALHESAHEMCFIANSVNFRVECEPEIKTEL